MYICVRKCRQYIEIHVPCFDLECLLFLVEYISVGDVLFEPVYQHLYTIVVKYLNGFRSQSLKNKLSHKSWLSMYIGEELSMTGGEKFGSHGWDGGRFYLHLYADVKNDLFLVHLCIHLNSITLPVLNLCNGLIQL